MATGFGRDSKASEPGSLGASPQGSGPWLPARRSSLGEGGCQPCQWPLEVVTEPAGLSPTSALWLNCGCQKPGDLSRRDGPSPSLSLPAPGRGAHPEKQRCPREVSGQSGHQGLKPRPRHVGWHSPGRASWPHLPTPHHDTARWARPPRPPSGPVCHPTLRMRKLRLKR